MNELVMWQTLAWGALGLAAVLPGLAFRVARKGWTNPSELGNIADVLESAAARVDDLDRKNAEYFGKIEEVIAEREQWRELYNDQAGGHENAQALMLQSIGLLSKAYQKATGKNPPKLDPMIEQVTSAWAAEHGASIRELRGDDGQRRDDSKSGPD